MFAQTATKGFDRRTHKKALTPSCRSLHYNQAFWNAVHSSAIVSARNVKSFSHFDWGYGWGVGGERLNEIWIRWARSLGDFFTTNPRLMMMSAYEMAFALFRIASQCGLWLWILRLKNPSSFVYQADPPDRCRPEYSSPATMKAQQTPTDWACHNEFHASNVSRTKRSWP